MLMSLAPITMPSDHNNVVPGMMNETPTKDSENATTKAMGKHHSGWACATPVTHGVRSFRNQWANWWNTLCRLLFLNKAWFSIKSVSSTVRRLQFCNRPERGGYIQ